MSRRFWSERVGTLALLAGVFLAGCAQPRQHAFDPPPFVSNRLASNPSGPVIIPASYHEQTERQPDGSRVPINVQGPFEVDELVRYAVELNPRLAKATFSIDAAQGRYIQAGLYPNPVLAITGDELADRTGPGGIWTAPQFTQEIVTGRKLTLAQAVAAKEVDQSILAMLRERYDVVGSVRAAFYDLYALEQRIAVLDDLATLAAEAVKNGQILLDNKQIARLDLIQLQVEHARFQSQAEAARRELPGARKRLAAVIGNPRLAITTVAGPFEEVPLYDHERVMETVLATHPEARSARVAVERAQAAIRRAEAEPIPNLSLSTGYTYQGQNRSNDWLIGVSAPIPLWNRNQGNIRAARAELGVAINEVGRVENDLAERVATALREYDSARKLAEQYRNDILPKAEETYKLSLEAFKGGQFEYLRVIQSQRAVAEVRLEYVQALGDAWKAAAELSGLLLEEWWPGPPPQMREPGAGPAMMPPPKPLPEN